MRSEFCKTEDMAAWLQLLKREPRPAKDVDAAAPDQIEKPLAGCGHGEGGLSTFGFCSLSDQRRAVFFSFSLFACFFFSEM